MPVKIDVVEVIEWLDHCSIKGGNGFAVDPNWQNGGVTAWVWPDGRFQIDLINIDAMSGVLTWGSNRLSLAS